MSDQKHKLIFKDQNQYYILTQLKYDKIFNFNLISLDKSNLIWPTNYADANFLYYSATINIYDL